MSNAHDILCEDANNPLSKTAAIILAAGKSTRMKSDLPKVLHEVCGQPMLAYVISACRLAGADRLLVVVGYGRQEVQQRFESSKDITWVFQDKQKGTGHAVLCCREALKDFTGSIMVIAGDMPLVRREPLARLIETRKRLGDALSMATTILDDPSGYGRIVRDDHGELDLIVEDRDCTPSQQEIHEVNPSYYCFDSVRLFEALENVKESAGSGEYYLTDVVGIMKREGHAVSAKVNVPREDALGINSRLDLAMVNRVMQDRIQLRMMNDGVTIIDPDNTWIEADVTVGKETVIGPFSLIATKAIIGERCRIGPFARVEAGQMVEEGSIIGPTMAHGVSSA